MAALRDALAILFILLGNRNTLAFVISLFAPLMRAALRRKWFKFDFSRGIFISGMAIAITAMSLQHCKTVRRLFWTDV